MNQSKNNNNYIFIHYFTILTLGFKSINLSLFDLSKLIIRTFKDIKIIYIYVAIPGEEFSAQHQI